MNLLLFSIPPLLFAGISAGYSPYNESFFNKPEFLDRSDLIEKFLNYPASDRIPYFTSPHLFGKTTILRMIQKFFEIETDLLHFPLYQIDTEAYWIFNQSKIAQHKWTFDHLARHPVIYLNFSHPLEKLFQDNVEDNVIYYMNQIIGSIYDDYRWLRIYCMHITNKQLRYREHEIEFIEIANKRGLTRMDIVTSLDMLATLLYKYYNCSRVVILIDELDKPLNEALGSEENLSQEIKVLYELINDMLMQTTRPENDQIFKTLICGTSQIMFSSAVKNMTRIEVYPFLDDHHFELFSGYSESNLRELFNWYKCKKKEKINIRKYYKAYSTKEKHTSVYNSYSIMKYFGIRDRTNSTEIKPYWLLGDKGQFIYKFFNSYEFLELFSKLSFNKTIETVLPDVNDSMTFEILLLALESNFDADEFPFTDILVSFLFEQGFLAYTDEKNIFAVPSPEIKYAYEDTLIRYFTQTGINLTEIGLCFCNILNDTSSEDAEKLEVKFQAILTKHFVKVKKAGSENYTQEHTFLSIINLAAKTTAAPGELIEHPVERFQKSVAIYEFDDSAVIVSLRHKKAKFTFKRLEQAGKQIFERKDYKQVKSVGINVDKDGSANVLILVKNARD